MRRSTGRCLSVAVTGSSCGLRTANDHFKDSLFRLDVDPSESSDLMGAEPEMAKHLRAELERWIELHSRTDFESSMNPHPGWPPPRDYAAAAENYDPIG